MPGKLIVIEGIDGSGKSTQFQLICEQLDAEGMQFERIIFPRYKESSSAMLRMYLDGAFGDSPDDVNPYAASTFYAVDRFASYRMDWREHYEGGGLVLTDRYTTANAVHQGAKLPKPQQPAFFDWLEEYEYHLLEVPAPDLVIYLNIDPQLALDHIQKRQLETGGNGDIHERDAEFLRNCAETGLHAAEYFGWDIVNCDLNGEVRDAKEIQSDIMALIREVLETR